MSEPVYRRTVPLMGTLVTIDVVGNVAGLGASRASAQLEAAVERAFAWFQQIEECCTRFDPQSELVRLSAHVGVVVPASAILYEAVQFALAIAEETGGAFDPTVGSAMEMRGFNRDYRSGRAVRTAPDGSGPATYRPTYRDVRLDPHHKTITLLRPLLLDLGAVAKGLAIDMAAHELRPFENFAINAGGDIYVSGHNREGGPWSVGIRHPRVHDALCDFLSVSDCAVCTSGDYERRCPSETEAEVDGHHILDPRLARSGSSARAAASVTVVAPTAMLADVLATAAFVLGPAEGIALLERLGVNGFIISPTLERYATQGMRSDYELSGSTILPDAEGPSSGRAGGSDRPGRAI